MRGSALPLLLVQLLLGSAPRGAWSERTWRELCGNPQATCGDLAPNQQPGVRAGSAGVLMNNERSLFVFGGQDENRVLSSETWVYSFTDNVWQRPVDDAGACSRVPCARAFASVVQISTRLILFGGMCSRSPLPAGGTPCGDTLWEFDWTHATWERVDLGRDPATAPVGRAGHAAVAVGSAMYVYGGSLGGNRTADDDPELAHTLWKYEWSSRQWMRIDGVLPIGLNTQVLGRYGHAGAYDDLTNKLMFYGGMGAAGYVLSDMLEFDLGAGSFRVRSFFQAPFRAFHQMVFHRPSGREGDDERYFLYWGGFGHNLQGNNALTDGVPKDRNDIYMYQIREVAPGGGQFGTPQNPKFVLITPDNTESSLPKRQQAVGGGLLDGIDLVSFGGATCPDVITSMGECLPTYSDVWAYDFKGVRLQRGVVEVAVRGLDGATGTVGERVSCHAQGNEIGFASGVSTFTFVDVPANTMVAAFVWRDFAVAGLDRDILKPATRLALRPRLVGHSEIDLVAIREDGFSPVVGGEVRVEIWDQNTKRYRVLPARAPPRTDGEGRTSLSLTPTSVRYLEDTYHTSYRLHVVEGGRIIGTASGVEVGEPPCCAGQVVQVAASSTTLPRVPVAVPDSGVLRPLEVAPAVPFEVNVTRGQYAYFDLDLALVRAEHEAELRILVSDPDVLLEIWWLFPEGSAPLYPREGESFFYGDCFEGKPCSVMFAPPNGKSGPVRASFGMRLSGRGSAAPPPWLLARGEAVVRSSARPPPPTPPPPPPPEEVVAAAGSSVDIPAVVGGCVAAVVALLALHYGRKQYLQRKRDREHLRDIMEYVRGGDERLDMFDDLVRSDLEDAHRQPPKSGTLREKHDILKEEKYRKRAAEKAARGGRKAGGGGDDESDPFMRDMQGRLLGAGSRAEAAGDGPTRGAYARVMRESHGREGDLDSFMHGLDKMADEYRRTILGVESEGTAPAPAAEQITKLGDKYERLYAAKARLAAMGGAAAPDDLERLGTPATPRVVPKARKASSYFLPKPEDEGEAEGEADGGAGGAGAAVPRAPPGIRPPTAKKPPPKVGKEAEEAKAKAEEEERERRRAEKAKTEAEAEEAARAEAEAARAAAGEEAASPPPPRGRPSRRRGKPTPGPLPPGVEMALLSQAAGAGPVPGASSDSTAPGPSQLYGYGAVGTPFTSMGQESLYGSMGQDALYQAYAGTAAPSPYNSDTFTSQGQESLFAGAEPIMIGALAPLPAGPSSRPQKHRGGRGRATPGPGGGGGARGADAWAAADAAADSGQDMALVLHEGGAGERRLSTDSAPNPKPLGIAPSLGNSAIPVPPPP